MAPKTKQQQVDTGVAAADVRMMLGIAVGAPLVNDAQTLQTATLRAAIVKKLPELAPADVFQIWKIVFTLAGDADGAAAAVAETQQRAASRRAGK